MGGGQHVDRLGGDTGRGQEEGDADDLQRALLILGCVRVLQLPDDDERGKDSIRESSPKPTSASATDWAATAAASKTTDPTTFQAEHRVLQP